MTPSAGSARPAVIPRWATVPVAAAAAILLYLSFPSAGLWFLAPPAVALVLLVAIGRSIAGAILVGAVFGLTFYLALLSWAARYLGPVPWLALAGLEGLLTAVGIVALTLSYRWFPAQRPALRLWLLPALLAAVWLAREVVIGSWPYGGFPWARLGLTQVDGPFAPVASWVGVGGLSFVLVFLVATLIERVRMPRRTPRRRLVAPLLAVIALALLPAFPTSPAGTVRIAAVQGDGPTGYFDRPEPYAVLEAQVAATEEIVGGGAAVVVWPEGGIGADPLADPGAARRLSRLAARAGAPLLLNAATGRGDEYFNTSFLWREEGTAEQVHDKRHPVPFGEYVPDRPFFEALAPELIGLLQREYTAGTNTPLVEIDGVRLGLAICFDVIYDEVIGEGVRAGADVLVFQTNNADFRGTDENLQQLAIARMRAVETGRAVVNISTVGRSQVIRADGSTQAALEADEAGALLEDVELRSGLTPAVVIGSALQGLLALAGAAGLIAVGWFARRKR